MDNYLCPSLQDGNTGLINAEPITGKEGGNFTHTCSFSFTVFDNRKIFCKEGCEEKDILVETTGDRAQRGRYSIVYEKTGQTSSVLYVSITNLTKSDSGRYTCRVDRGLFANKDFKIRVEDASITKPTQTLRPRPPSVPSTSVRSTSTPTTTQSLNISSGSSTPSSASTDTSNQPGQQQRADGPGVLLYVGLALVTMVIMLSVAVLFLCRRRASKPKGQPVETEFANMTEANRVYEEIRQDRESGSPPVEISTVYTYVKYVKPNAEEATDTNGSVAAATCEKKTEDDSNKLTYSEVDFSNSTAASLNSAPRGDADNVIYSVPRGAASDGNRVEDASPPLYSTVTLPHV
ncbi:uncharacterized protein [Pagrus major]|uniref:uncharacterized protein n=1 Tax=Pagrus major TaxID=143350 RepID=UPI003CC8B213